MLVPPTGAIFKRQHSNSGCVDRAVHSAKWIRSRSPIRTSNSGGSTEGKPLRNQAARVSLQQPRRSVDQPQGALCWRTTASPWRWATSGASLCSASCSDHRAVDSEAVRDAHRPRCVPCRSGYPQRCHCDKHISNAHPPAHAQLAQHASSTAHPVSADPGQHLPIVPGARCRMSAAPFSYSMRSVQHLPQAA